ncbi:MAG: hypothetical protein AAGC46_00330 [Solirubrobacteraceae bacterium]|nr:hypothetical protein [Patulibacter sp.]
MSSAADDALATVRTVLAGRHLIWFGIRGEDGEALLRVPELSSSFSIIAKLRSSSLPERSNVSLEGLTGVREDLDTYDIDDPGSRTADVVDFRRRLLNEVSGPCVMVTYRPSALVSALAFAKADTMTLAGLYKDRQQAFEHKPWVETSLANRGVRGLGWTYVADEHRHLARRHLHDGPQVVRANRSSGGVGIALARTEEELEANWPEQQEAFVGLAPYLSPTVPLNFSGCVFPDGTVRLHPASVQLVGIPSCTDRPFGYAGNDFGALKFFDRKILEELDNLGRTVGAWLHHERYEGVFGVDALVHNGAVHFTEINARFQGSSALSARVAREVDVPDLFLDHLAATLGVAPDGDGMSITEWASMQPDLSKLVVHNTSGTQVTHDPSTQLPDLRHGVRLDQLPSTDTVIRPDGVLGSLTFSRSVTESGFAVDDAVSDLAHGVATAYVPAAAADLA